MPPADLVQDPAWRQRVGVAIIRAARHVAVIANPHADYMQRDLSKQILQHPDSWITPMGWALAVGDVGGAGAVTAESTDEELYDAALAVWDPMCSATTSLIPRT
ncbi:hypothetical protein [Actinoalloteichus sp. GBA129-24]|uniref:hypothetical protein n=1 Tax=Actinoalloteichus sp. GBA129-24 TaxID=1612551 RepID=UPI0012F8B422|nr:hypothetical protein [Actinoalloteichus sp. GBA129-24]